MSRSGKPAAEGLPVLGQHGVPRMGPFLQQLRDKIGVESDLGRAIEVGFDFGYPISHGVEFVRVLKAGFGRAVSGRSQIRLHKQI